MRRFAIAVAFTLLGCAAAQAQDTVKIVVPFAAGGPVDAMARLLAQEMQGPLGISIVVENRAGGGGVIAADAVSRAPADGKTLLMGSQGAHVITAVLQPHVKYDPVKSFDAIAMVGASPTLLVANPQLPFKDFKDLVALAKSRNLSYASAGPGTTMHIAGELINTGAGIKIAHVPYRGVAPALPDLIAGRLDVVPADAPVLLPLVQANSGPSGRGARHEAPWRAAGHPEHGRARLHRDGDGELVRPGCAGGSCAGRRQKARRRGAHRDQVGGDPGAYEEGRDFRNAERQGVRRAHRQRRGPLAADAAEARHHRAGWAGACGAPAAR